MLTIDITGAPAERIAFAASPPAELTSMPAVPVYGPATRSRAGAALVALARGRQVGDALDGPATAALGTVPLAAFPR
ncbi:hypothetical protein [Dactylosporangium sp. NPDC051484]|uniref:hypothetical protein n=1 Tax=Dactylosporangium sp. NPDC051484 TaxID=3154942 RepID=UPI00344B96F1